jgi:hypothetical protein
MGLKECIQGEMTQALYAHMNNKTIKKKECIQRFTFSWEESMTSHGLSHEQCSSNLQKASESKACVCTLLWLGCFLDILVQVDQAGGPLDK